MLECPDKSYLWSTGQTEKMDALKPHEFEDI